MNTYLSTTFGNLNLDALDTYYEAEIVHDGKSVELDLNFEQTQIEKEAVIRVDDYLAGLEMYEQKVRQWLRKDFASDGWSKEYIEYHLDVLEDRELKKLLWYAVPLHDPSLQLFSLVHLDRLGFYPEIGDAIFAIFDYVLDKDLTDLILVVGIRKDGTYFITMES